MGLSARDVADSSIWQLMALYRGYLRAQGVKLEGGAPSDSAFERALREARDE